jgi:AcrR family transcriptional regulator
VEYAPHHLLKAEATVAGVGLRSDALANQDRVLDAAARAFARGDVDVSLRAIAREAGVGIATLYRRFPKRELLVEAVYRSESERLSEAANDLLVTSSQPVEALWAWLMQFLDYLATKRGMANALRVLLTSDEGLRLQTRASLIAACERLLRAAAAAGQVRDNLDATQVVMAVGGFALIADEQQRPDLRRQLLTLLFDGLRAGPVKSSARAQAGQ